MELTYKKNKINYTGEPEEEFKKKLEINNEEKDYSPVLPKGIILCVGCEIPEWMQNEQHTYYGYQVHKGILKSDKLPFAKRNQERIDKYTKIYTDAKENGQSKQCLLGKNEQYRIAYEDSDVPTLSDPSLVLEYVLYPSYIDGNEDVKEELINVITEFINSNDPLEYLQAYRYLREETFNEKFFYQTPFSIFDESFIEQMIYRLPEMEDRLMSCKTENFSKREISVYDKICNIIYSNPLFETYLY